MSYIKRAMEETFLRLNKQFCVILVTGPRQVGKTTMLKKLLSDENIGRNYISLDDLELRTLAKNDPKLFLQIHKPPIFIDEVQYAPELFSCIKTWVDEHQNAGDFWLSGSQLYRLMRGVSESLAGRVGLLDLAPLSQSEIKALPSVPFEVDFEQLSERSKLCAKTDINSIYQMIFKGGMPQICAGKSDISGTYGSYFRTYIERDVHYISERINALEFSRFVTAVAAHTGQLLNIKSIADLCGINQITAKSWLNILETLGIIFYLHPYSNNTLKRTVKTPKLYFYDSGLVCYLTKWADALTLMNGAMSGQILENFVVSEIMKSYYNAGLRPFLYYYRDTDGKEIDIIIEKNGTLFPIEIKKTAAPNKKMTSAFNVIENTNLLHGMGAIICMYPEFMAIDRQTLIVPVSLI